ncbi:P-loop containing nucleoside triphosphate hydrolase protein [Pluteus cervinus]|uniref:P-loop containing nucleoside triphosphate hydrolase protein n=1 Tax=Pluteus cervinus TaxID=181527 RepID=A0ACD3API0_9AGAR|nr:P-loop containing nucleoside triphosphate hydrolase protein [Pluteus cervinus]
MTRGARGVSVDPAATGGSSGSAIPNTRGYQLEMLHTSLQKNIIIALDTGSGKTHIAVLRIKREIEIEETKLCWFLAPTVTLCKQQKSVIETALPVSVGIISGESDPNQWKDQTLWEKVLGTHRVMVSTPQVLLDALRHGYVVLGRDVSLLIFDEAHHAVSNDPYNRIMVEFYHSTPPRKAPEHHGFVRPMVLGLTASPIFGGDPIKAFREIEKNLDSTICTPLENREELTKFVHRPEFRHFLYRPHDSTNTYFSTNLATLHEIVSQLDITKDPYIASLKRRLASTQKRTREWQELDQKLSKAIRTENSFTQKGLRDFARTAVDIARDLGSWAADWYVWSVVEKSIYVLDPLNNVLSSWKDSEKAYLLKFLKALVLTQPSMGAEDLIDGLSDKAKVLIRCLLQEKEETEARNEAYSGIIFVQRRDAVIVLAEILRYHPETSLVNMFRPGCLLGSSDSGYRHSFLDITRYLLKESQEETLMDFKLGQKNLIVSTSVAEEGIDIQACGSVIRWDPPLNMASWAQSRGRARRRQSTFTLLFQAGGVDAANVTKWQQLERKMVELYKDPNREVNGYRHSFLDITRYLLKESQEETLMDFKLGQKNLIVSTSVAEEGIDIQACGSVIRWDPPLNMASWAQSRGRARRRQSTFTLLFQAGGVDAANVTKWQQLERKMVELYKDPNREVKLRKLVEEEEEALRPPGEDDEEEEYLEFKIPLTGATLTLHSAVPHIAHFCASMPRAMHVNNAPIYLLDPPDHPPEWYDLPHEVRVLTSKREYEGPWGVTLVLPRMLPWELREFSVEMKYTTKVKAYRQAAFKAYKALYEAGLLNDNLLPLDSERRKEGEEELALKEEIGKRKAMERVAELQLNPWKRRGQGGVGRIAGTGESQDHQGDPPQDEPQRDEDETWYLSELRVDGLPPLRVFTRVEILCQELQEQGTLLHRPGLPPIRTTLHPQGKILDENVQELIQRAGEYTRMMFWSVNGSRMDWDKLDFSYLFLPYDDVAGGGVRFEQKVQWEERREWRASLPHPHVPTSAANPQPFHPSDNILCQARKFGKQYNYPNDITMVRPGLHFGKGYRFVKWRGEDEPLSEEEENSIGNRYRWIFRNKGKGKLADPSQDVTMQDDSADVATLASSVVKQKPPRGIPEGLTIIWPLLQVEPLPPRTNFLTPTSSTTSEKKKRRKSSTSDASPTSNASIVLLPEFSAVTLLSEVDLEYAALLPSILRYFTIALTVDSLRQNLFFPAMLGGGVTYGPGLGAQPDHPQTELSSSPLSSLPLPLLTTALLTPSASEQFNYQRLEILGDTVLKFLVSFQLFAEYPIWHEGYLTQKKDRIVSNGRLAKDAVGKELYKWMIRDRLISKKWRPSYLTPPPPKPPIQPLSTVANPDSTALEPTGDRLPTIPPPKPKKPSSGPKTSRNEGLPPPTPASLQTSDPEAAAATTSQVQAPKPKKRKRKPKKDRKPVDGQDLSTKMLADVIEALLGASYLFGGFDLAFECGLFFNLGMRWQPSQARFDSVLTQVRASRQPLPSPSVQYGSAQRSIIDSLPDVALPSQLKHVEEMLGYTFKHKALLIEALTHASYQQSVGNTSGGDSPPIASSSSHPSPPSPSPSYLYNTRSYERLEFLGDAVLDMILVDILFRAPDKNYSPGHIHQRKMALVNAQFLAYVCLKTKVDIEKFMPKPKMENAGLGSTQHLPPPHSKHNSGTSRRRSSFSSALVEQGPTSIALEKTTQTVYLWQCLLHSSTRILEDQTQTFGRFQRHETSITSSFVTPPPSPSAGPSSSPTGSPQPRIFPWAALTSLQAPKFFSDVIESILGAIFLDSGSLHLGIENVKKVLGPSGFGVLPILDQIINDDIDVLHPVTRVGLWADKNGKTLDFEYIRERGHVSALVMVDGKEEVRVKEVYFGKSSLEEAKYKAAEAAIKVLRLRDVGLKKTLEKKLDRKKRGDVEF